MNWDQIQGKIEQYKGDIRKKWGKLTDSDLEMLKGERDKLSGIIQERYGEGKDKVEKEIDDFLEKLKH